MMQQGSTRRMRAERKRRCRLVRAACLVWLACGLLVAADANAGPGPASPPVKAATAAEDPPVAKTQPGKAPCVVDPASLEFDYTEERLGPLRIGAPEGELIATLGPPERKEPAYHSQVTGDWEQEWAWPAKGVRAFVAAERKGAAGKIIQLEVTAPSDLRTGRGIGLGSTPEEIEAAYPRALWDICQATKTSIIVGSVYGGVAFELRGGRVATIAIGAFAE